MPKKYPPEFKRDVVMVARRRGATAREVAADFGISASSVARWLRQADVDDGVVEGQTTSEQQEVVRLRRENRRQQQEVEVLRRATAYFAKDAAPK